jgi:hypothetical protein
VEKFIRNNLPKVQQWHVFCNGVNDELVKSASVHEVLSKLCQEFNDSYSSDVVKNFAALQQIAQNIKDEYYKLMQKAASDMADKYSQLKKSAEELIIEINSLPGGLNDAAKQKVESILQYAQQRIKSKVEIDFDIKEIHSRFTYSEMLSFIDLYNTKKVDLEITKASLLKETPPVPGHGKPEPAPAPKTFSSKIPGTKLKVGEYKQWLHQELQKLAGAKDDDNIEISNN